MLSARAMTFNQPSKQGPVLPDQRSHPLAKNGRSLAAFMLAPEADVLVRSSEWNSSMQRSCDSTLFKPIVFRKEIEILKFIVLM